MIQPTGVKSKAAAAAVLLLFFLTSSCAVNPVTGRKEISLISEQGEIAMGEKTDVEIKQQYGVYNDPGLQAYVEKVGMRLAPYSHRPQLTYHFAVLDTPVINAFAVPGGYIYVTRGILALMQTEAELAVVLGHELGHVNARHSVRKLSQLMIVQLGLAVGSALSETFSKISGAAGIGVQLLFLKFSRDDERQADALGVEYSRGGGYDPGEMIGFFHGLQKMGDLSEGHNLPGFLSTHPLTSERIRNTQAMLTAQDQQLVVARDAYLNRIENLVYGSDPRQGYVEDQAFYHPTLRFTFVLPQDWELKNTPSQVILATKDGKAAAIFQAEQSSGELRDFAQKKMAQLEGARLINEKDLRINGLTSYQQLLEIEQSEQENLRTQMSFIRYGGYFYTFTTLSTTQNYDSYASPFHSLVHSFRPLKDPKYLNRQPQRIRLIRADGRKDLKTIFRGENLKEDVWPRFAIMNGMELDQVPVKGSRIKVAR